MTWISSPRFAQIAGLDRTTIARLCKASVEGRKPPFEFPDLVVRTSTSRKGGRSGRVYEIELASLPEPLREAYQLSTGAALPAPPAVANPGRRVTRPLPGQSKRAAIAANRFRSIRPALGTPRGSEARHVAVQVAAAVAQRSHATIYRWIDHYEERGMAGLVPAPPQQRPVPRVSRAFDLAFAERYGSDALQTLGDELDERIKALWIQKTSKTGMRSMAGTLKTALEEYCSENDWRLADADHQPCYDRIRLWREFRIVRTYLTDADVIHEMLPRIRRDWSNTPAMDVVFVDVKHLDLDIYDKGERIKPAMIGFHDAGTGRIYAHLVKLKPGGQGQEASRVSSHDVLEAFGHMLCAPEWGMPRVIYMDNGKENTAFSRVASRISASLPKLRVITAGPYEPQAKTIEGMFAQLNRLVFQQMRAFNGGKPRKLRERRADQHAPMDYGGWDQFCERFAVLLEDYHCFDRKNGTSPRKRFEEKADKPGRQLDVWSPDQVDAVFGEEVSHMVRQGWLVHKGRRYTGECLFLLHGERTSIIEPIVGTGAAALSRNCSHNVPAGPPIMLVDDQVRPLREDDPFPPLDDDASGKVDGDWRRHDALGQIFNLANRVDLNLVTMSEQMAIIRAGQRHRERYDMLEQTPGTYRGEKSAPTFDAIERTAQAKLDKLIAPTVHSMPQDAAVANTRVMRAIWCSIERAISQQKTLVVTGSPEIGKTYAALSFARNADLNLIHLRFRKKLEKKSKIEHLRQCVSDLLSSDLFDKSQSMLPEETAEIRTKHPDLPCLVIIDDADELRTVNGLESFHAEAVRAASGIRPVEMAP